MCIGNQHLVGFILIFLVLYLHIINTVWLSLLYRCFHLCSDLIKLHREVSELKLILGRNGYPSKVIDFCIKNFLNKIHLPKKTVATAAKKEIFIMLPFLGPLSLQIRTWISKLAASKLPYCNLKVVFRSTRRLSNCFSFKDNIPKFLCSGLVYKFSCSDCNVTYYAKTKRHFKVRMSEHLSISSKTGKTVKTMHQTTAIYDHFLTSSSCSPTNFENFSILAHESNDLKLTLI